MEAIIPAQELMPSLSHSGHLTCVVFRGTTGFANNTKNIVGVGPLHFVPLSDRSTWSNRAAVLKGNIWITLNKCVSTGVMESLWKTKRVSPLMPVAIWIRYYCVKQILKNAFVN